MSDSGGFPVLDGKDLPGFTPVRRPQPRSFNDTPISNVHVPWTTTRCNRLIRPISSRIATLRKQKLTPGSRPNQAAVLRGASTLQGYLLKDTEQKDSENSSLQSGNSDDLEWTPDERPRKKLRRTYSAKNGRNVVADPAPRLRRQVVTVESILAQAPAFVSLAESQEREPEVAVGTGQEENPVREKRVYKSKKVDGRHNFRQLAKTVSPDDWMLFDGLYSSLDHLLKSTAKSRPAAPAGPKTLFSMCLRKVPQVIAQEQEEEDGDGFDSLEDVANAMYEDLEAYGSMSNSGWKPLREIARAHGVMILAGAIKEGLISPSLSRGLILLCLQNSTFDEAESLCSALLSTVRPLQQPGKSACSLFGAETSIAMQTLKTLATRSGRWDFLFRALTDLLVRGIIPVGWMSSVDMIFCWNQVFMLSTEEETVNSHANALIRLVISLGYRERTVRIDALTHKLRRETGRRTKSYTSLSRHWSGQKQRQGSPEKQPDFMPEAHIEQSSIPIVSNLVSILLSVNGSRSDDSSPPQFWIDILHTVLTDYSCQQELRQYYTNGILTHTNLEIPSVLSFASLLLPFVAHGQTCASEMPRIPYQLLLEHQEDGSVRDRLSSFVRSFAICWSLLSSLPTSDLLDSLVHHCIDLAKADNPEVPRKLLFKLAAAVAFDFAEDTSDMRDLDWALEIEEAVESASGQVETEKKVHGSTRFGNIGTTEYRWEEGICEWIAKTPAVRKQKPRASLSTECSFESSSSVLPPQFLQPVVPIQRVSTISPLRPESLANLVSPSQVRYCSNEQIEGIPSPIIPKVAAVRCIVPRRTTQAVTPDTHLNRRSSQRLTCVKKPVYDDSIISNETAELTKRISAVEAADPAVCAVRSHNIRSPKRSRNYAAVTRLTRYGSSCPKPQTSTLKRRRASESPQWAANSCLSSEDELGF
ncbi:MAG: hypothetical protein MMC23_002667 [Stictis urceolatum]|nr:hypothetical protein [Stictis urceolata]